MKYQSSNVRRSLLPNTEDPESGGVETTSEVPKTPIPPKVEDNDEPLRDEGKKALAAERAAKKALEKQLKEFQTKYGGIDLEKYQALVELEQTQAKEAEQRKVQELEAQKRYDEAIAAKESQHLTEVDRLKKELAELQSRIATKDQAIAAREVKQAFMVALTSDEVGGFSEDVPMFLAVPEIGGWLKYDEQAEEVIVVDPKTGDRPTNEKGNYLSIKDWIETWKASKPRFFKAKNTNTGTGYTQTKGRAPTPASSTVDTKNFNFAELMNKARSK